MNCWDRFDMKISLCFTGNKDRAASLDRELGRVGLRYDSRIWNVPNMYEALAVSRMNPVRTIVENAGFRNSGFGHYHAVKQAYELGAERVLIFEDDIRFLKDLGRISSIVEDAPVSHDIWLFDLLKRGKDSSVAIKAYLDGHRLNGGDWAEPTDHPCSMACYALSRRAMKWLIGCFEGAHCGRWMLHIADHYLHAPWRRESGVRVACAWPLCAIQVPVGALANTAVRFGHGNRDCQLDWYREIGIDPDDYASA